MEYIADLHIHSKYSRATSRDLDLANIEKWAKIKGVDIIATGDFTYPAWFKEISEKLEPAEQGLYKLKNSYTITPSFKDEKSSDSNRDAKSCVSTDWDDSKRPVKFFLSTEISLIYSKNDKTRRLHILVFAPSLEVVKKINEHLDKIGNIKSDGRPILGLDAEEFTKIILDKSEKCMVVPAHAWTPWFSVFGSKSGFDSLEECLGKMTPYIYALETGLSSDPAMNWRLSKLDNITLISNSDAHSPSNIAREANIFNLEKLSYNEICNVLKEKNSKKLLGTIEFYPEEGKYHFDGHRDCNIEFSPDETKKHYGLCPVCKKPLTLGVAYRVDSLADRRIEIKHSINEQKRQIITPKTTDNLKYIPYINLVGLEKIIAEAKGVKSVHSKAVQNEYKELIKNFGTELKILMDVTYEEMLKKRINPQIIEGIKRVREGKLHIKPGFDGVYGEVEVFKKGENEKIRQGSLL